MSSVAGKVYWRVSWKVDRIWGHRSVESVLGGMAGSHMCMCEHSSAPSPDQSSVPGIGSWRRVQAKLEYSFSLLPLRTKIFQTDIFYSYGTISEKLKVTLSILRVLSILEKKIVSAEFSKTRTTIKNFKYLGFQKYNCCP